MCRQTTTLERKLEKLAAQIGQYGLGAAIVALGAMSWQYTYDTLVVQGHAWEWSFLSDYLRFIITAITIVVGCDRPGTACMSRKADNHCHIAGAPAGCHVSLVW